MTMGEEREMNKTKFGAHIFACLLVVALLESFASAQSTISGVVKDTSGAVMAGVKVEAASEALIERSRTTTTSEDGRYSIIDIRPGLYTDRKSTRLNSSHRCISYAVFCL